MGASRPSKKKKKKTSVICSTISSPGEPIPFLEYDGKSLLQTKVFTSQAKESPLPATTFGPRLKELESHFNVLLFESSHPVVETLDLRGGRQGTRRIRIVSHCKGGKKYFLLRGLS